MTITMFLSLLFFYNFQSKINNNHHQNKNQQKLAGFLIAHLSNLSIKF